MSIEVEGGRLSGWEPIDPAIQALLEAYEWGEITEAQAKEQIADIDPEFDTQWYLDFLK